MQLLAISRRPAFGVVAPGLKTQTDSSGRTFATPAEDSTDYLRVHPDWLTLAQVLQIPAVLTQASLEQNRGFLRLTPQAKDNAQSEKRALVWFPKSISLCRVRYHVQAQRTICQFESGALVAYMEPGEMIACALGKSTCGHSTQYPNSTICAAWDGKFLNLVDSSQYQPDWTTGTEIL